MEHPLQKRFLDFIDTQALWAENSKILVAVSGGVDSMVLVTLCLRAQVDFGIAHCNFNLRGAESDEDQKFVEDWARSNEVTVHAKSFDLKNDSVQVAAREARYAWFSELLKHFGYSKVATAHHLNDSLETILFNLSRGTGVQGLGIKSTSNETVRPLLFASREEIEKYAADLEVPFREDSSNASNAYDRNRIRHEVVPVLKELNPSLMETFSNTHQRLQAAGKLVAAQVEAMKREHLQVDDDLIELKTQWVSDDADRVIFSEILGEFGFSYLICQQILGSLDKSGKSFRTGEMILTIDRGSLFIKREQEEVKSLSVVEPGDYTVSGITYKIQLLDVNTISVEDDTTKAYLDAEKARFPLKIRAWREGDRFKPLGMKGSKKVSDLLIDLKIPVAKKNRVQLVLSNDEICWVVGQRTSESCKVTGETKKALVISATSKG